MKNHCNLMQNVTATAKFVWAFAILFSLNASQSSGQTTLFNDNFNANNSATFSTTGAIGTYPNWSVTRSGNDWGARVNSNLLELSNDASGFANPNGWVCGYRDIYALSGWNTTLSSNTGTITWEFNMQQIRPDPSGFGAVNYGVAFILAGTHHASATAGSGYAVVLGQTGTTDPIRLASYNNGLQGTLTDIITSNTAGLTDFGTDYLSVRVTYVPGTNTWQLFLRNDGSSAFTDPATGTLVSQGTAVNNTYTSTAGMRYIGGYWQGSTAAGQTAFFDNIYLKKTSAELTPCNYSQDFNSMGTAGTAPPVGWNHFGVLGGSNSSWPSSSIIPASGSPSAASSGTLNNTLIVSTGSGVSSNTQAYNFGASGNSDRALGTSPTSDAGNILELTLDNATGANVSSFNLSYDVRRFTAATNELPGYWIFVSSNNGSTWTEVSALRPTSTTVPNTVGVSNFGPTLVTLPAAVANGSPIKIRWVDDNANETSPDQIIGLDNVVISYGLTSATLGSALTTTYGTASTGVSFIATGVNVSGNITVTPQSNFEVSTTSATAGFGSAAVNVANNTTVWLRLSATAPAGTYNNVTAAVLSGGGSCSSVNVSTSGSGNSVLPALSSSTCNYSENFNSMGSLGTAPPAGWNQFGSLGGGNNSWSTSIPASGDPSAASGTLNNLLIVSDGSGNSDSQIQGFNFGATGNADRALGVWPTGRAGSILELTLANATGASISSFNTSYDVRRFSVASSTNELPGYWVFVSSDNGSTWVEIAALRPDITTVPNTVGVSNFGPVQVTLPAAVANGSPIKIRWVDDNANQSSPDQAIGLDNVVISYGLTAATLGSALTTTYGTASTGVSFIATGVNVSGNITVTPQSNFEVSTTSATAGFGTTAISVANNTTVWLRLRSTAPAGNYNGVTAAVLSGGGSCSNVNVSTSASSNTVSQRTLTITANNNSKTYGQSLTYGSGQTAFTSSGLQNGETIGSITITASGGTAANAAAGTYTLTPSAATGGTFTASNYSITYTTGTLTVNPATLNITAIGASKVYGNTLSTPVTGSSAFTSSGLQNGETIGSVTISYGTGAAATAAVGAYTGSVTVSAATGGTFTASNYNITYSAATLTVTQATLTITANAVSKVYGNTLSTPVTGSSAFTSNGLQNGETIGSATISYGTGAAATAAVGAYIGSVTVSAATGGTFTASNYSITYTSATLTVTQATLTITANAVSKVYGNTLSTPVTGSSAFTSNGLQNGETIGTVTISYGTGAAATAAVGTYLGSVTASAATGGTFTASNYSITYTAGQLSVTQATLTITASNAVKTEGNTLSTPVVGSTAFTSSGLQNGESIGSVTIAYGTGAAAGAAVGTYTGQVVASAATGGTFTAANYNIIYVAGDITVVASPEIQVSGTLSTVNTVYGTASPSPTQFSTQGSALTGNITVTPPAGYEISTSIGSGYSTSITLTATSGTVNPTTIYVRLAATTIPGTYSGNITVAGGSATTQTIATAASTVSPKVLTVSGLAANNNNKVYDRTASASVTGTATLTGIVGSDVVSLGGTPSFVYAQFTVGTAIAITANGYTLSGANAGNYTLTQPGPFSGDITPKPLTVSSAAVTSKTYDGNNSAVIIGSLNGVIAPDAVTFSGTGTFASANAGTHVVTSTSGISGADAANYSLTQPTGLSGTINPKVLSISPAPTIASKVYDATPTAGAVTVGTLSGLVGSETLSVAGTAANYSSADVGTYSGVLITYTLSNGTGLAANYSLANGSGTGVITPKALTISPAPSIASKVYDATTTAGAVTVGSLSGFIGSQTVTVTGVAANYSSANAGTYSGVVITYTLSNGTNGGLAANYSLANGSATGVITPKALSITSPTIASKAYDATTTAGAVTVGTLSGFVGIETVTATGSAAAYSSADVGTYTNVTVSYTLTNGTNGGLATNYSLAAGSATGVITQRALTITATDATKEIAQVLSGGAGSTAFTSSGLQGGQTIGSVTITYGAAAGSTGQGATAGTYAGQVTPSAATGGTFNAANYSITYVAGAIIVTNPNAMVLATLGTAVCENFSGLATSGTSSTMPTGWAFSESGTNANSTYTAATGSSNAGDTYSFGTSGDRTLGGIRSGSLNPTYGARIFNNTGSTISTITIAYTGKTWRVGAASRSDRIDFQYSSNATSLTTGTWTDENNLDYANPGQATGSGSLQHSANISYTMQGLSVAPGTSIWIRWTDFDATGADDGMGVDDVCITPIVPCTAPDLLVFDTQPSNVLQDATMSTVTVRAYCSATGLTATGFTGDITLAASGGGCGYVSQTVAAVNGVATFNNIIFTRSAQTGITLTASASGFSNLVSNTFDVTAPAGSITTVAQQDFGSNTSLAYTTTVGGVGVFNTANTRGVGSSNCMAFYYDACLSGASGNSSTAIFSQSSGLTGLSNVKLTFAMAWGGPQLAGANCDATSFSGTGLDSDDFVRLETSINGGAYVTTFQINGNSNKQYGFSTSGVSLNHNANQTLSSATEPSAFTINLPSGTTSVNFRFTFKANRRNEIIYLDDLSIQGNPPGAPVALPIANAGASFNGCNGGPNQLQGSAIQTVGAVAYSWTPTASLNNANISNPQATNTTTTTYTLSITDADNCSASSTVTVSVLNGTAGLWTGAENADWFNCQNWASGSIPTSTTDVTIPDVTNDPDIANGTAVCRNLSLSAAGSVLNMSGSSSQLNVNGDFSNIGNFISAGNVSFTGTNSQSITSVSPFQNLTIANASGVVLNSNVSVNGTLTLQNGNIAVQSNVLSITSALTNAISRPGTGHIIGNLQRTIATGTNSYTYPVGDASSYSPVVLNFNNVTAGGNVTVNSTSSDHPQLSVSGLEPSLSVNRFYTVANSGVVMTNYSATFNFVAGDKDPGITTTNLLVGLYSAGWAYPTTANPAATSIQATDLTTFGDFAIAECKTPAPFTITGGGEYCLGGSGLPVGLADSENGVTYELLRNSNSQVVTAGTGNGLSFGSQLNAGTYTIVAVSEASAACSSVMTGSAAIVIREIVVPSVSINTTATSICAGTSVTFTATPQFGGSTPVYQWKLNGANVGTNSATYTSSSLVNSDVVTCEMTSSEACPASLTVLSNAIQVAVLSSETPVITITPVGGNTICSGSALVFNSTSTFGGGTPQYNWLLNGVSQGVNSPNFTASVLSNGDQLQCLLTSDYQCVTSPSASSNTVTIQVTVEPSVDAGVNMTTCGASPYTFTNGASNGNTSSISWSENGAGSITAGANTLTPTYTPAAGDVGTTVTFTLTGVGLSPCDAVVDNVQLVIDTLKWYYVDADGDGFGDPNSIPTTGCTAPAGRVNNNTDCCDTNANINPMCEWWVDQDGDGAGSFIYDSGCLIGVTCFSASWPAQLIPYYPLATVNQGLPYTIDCNDNNSGIEPGIVEICGNLIDDNCNATIDEGCSGIDNDGFAFASLMNVNNTNAYYPNCQNTNGSVLNADISGEGNPANVSVGGGRDSWYRFVAPSTAAQIIVVPSGFDAVIELRTAAHPSGQIDVENANNTVGGTEIMNISGLTIGQTYYVAVRNFGATTGGTFTICVAPIRASGCATAQTVGGLSLCSSFKAVFRGATSYTFNFTGTGGAAPTPYATTSATVNNTTIIALSTPALALRNGGVYNVRVDANFTLLNGAGVADPTITLLGEVCSRTMTSVPLMEVLSTQRCASTTLNRSSLLRAVTTAGGTTSACSAIGYSWRFTRVANCTGTPIPGQTPATYTSTGVFLPLYVLFPNGSSYPLPNIGYWKVEVAPIFSYSTPLTYTYGPVQIIQVNNTASSTMLPDEPHQAERSEIVAPADGIYPNPGDGRHVILKAPFEFPITQLAVFDELGRSVEGYQVISLDGEQYEIIFNTTLTNGLYHITWFSQGKPHHTMWLVNR